MVRRGAARNGRLTIEAENRAVNVWFARPNTNVVRQITRRKIIRPVHHDVVIAYDRHRVLAAKSVWVQNYFNVRVRVVQAVARRFQLWSADIFCSMQNLALQIRKIDFIVINQTDCSDTRRGQIERGRRTEPTRTDAQNARRFQPTLSGERDFRHDEMPRIALNFFGTQIGSH